MSENNETRPLGKKLVLQLETVRQLDMDELDSVSGGTQIATGMSETPGCTEGQGNKCKTTHGE